MDPSAVKGILRSPMNNCWACLGLGKALIVAFNSACTRSLQFRVACSPASLEAAGLVASQEDHWGRWRGPVQEEGGNDRAVSGRRMMKGGEGTRGQGGMASPRK